MSTEESPLAFYQTDELIDELMRRFDHVAFGALTIRSGTDVRRIRRFSGWPDTAAGLGMAVARLALAAVENMETPDDDDVRLDGGGDE
jgi:hypothetical protein